MDICRTIAQLRYNVGLSQEEFAERVYVSAKTVQRWESNSGVPNAENLINISKEFGVSLDALLNNCMPREAEEHYRKIFPERNRSVWESYEKDIMTEYSQSVEEGLDISRYKGLFLEVSKLPDNIFKKHISDTIFDIVINAPKTEKYIYNEPSDLESIKVLRKQYSYGKNKPDKDTLRSKIKGAWLGRICGCLLGKPIEGIRTKELLMLLKESNNYPMHRYILSADVTDKICEKISFNLKGRCWADTISCAPADDDTNYTVMASMLIDKYGTQFTPSDVMDMWVMYQPKDAYCTAERVAWRNYFNGYCPPDTAVYKNPYREWIGAQIRADYFGYINPGNPEFAAELAWRDASVSHVKNGIYGEMFVAAMLACAAVNDDIWDVINGGLSQIPSSSRLYEKITNVMNWYKNGICEEECRKRIHTEFCEHSNHDWCHTIPNAMIVVMALLYHNNYTGAVCSAVQTGFDTDCNGATVGSIFGMMCGEEAIGPEWTRCISNKLKTNIIEVSEFTIDELVEKTLKHINPIE